MNAPPPLFPRELSADELCRRCDARQLGFGTTAELDEGWQVLGQARAEAAIRFGTGIAFSGYNLFAMGPEGVGRRTIVRKRLQQQAAAGETPPDWCYVFNFEAPHRPRSLRLPAGRARRLQQDMVRLVEDIRAGIPSAFESDEYRARQREIETELGEKQDQAIGAIGERARSQGIALIRTPAGFGFAPLEGEGVMSPEAFHKLPQQEQKRVGDAIAVLQEALENAIHEMPKWRRDAQRRLRELNREVTRAAVNGLIEEMKAEYPDLPDVQRHLTAVQEDVLDHAEYFRQPAEGDRPASFGMPPLREAGEALLRRYQVNVLIDHADDRGAPIVYDDNPTHDNLVGRIEYIAQMGALVTDFTLIKAGSLHRANGGYLILDALKVLTQPLAWDALKRALRSREIRTQSLGQALSLVSTVSLEPEPVPLDVKVVLVGQRSLYYLLHAHDPEFAELFKVAVDFEEDMEREPQTERLYARMLAALARAERLRPFDAAAVAQVIEFGSRAAGDAGKLSVQLRDVVDLLREADYWAQAAGRGEVCGDDVQRALDARVERSDRVRDRLREQVLRGTLLIEVAGERTGQVNGLSVAQLGGFAFGMPHRISARVRLGAGRVVDIEREVELGGPIHSKGVLILSGFLLGRYASNQPLSLAASLVFEQSYGGVEGDSASSAELYALLSALADVPLRQSLAVTGSINQHGEVQAIGGVNEKIEGFFDICEARGLTGGQGVLIPASNVKNLMLSRSVVSAVAAGRFHIHAVAHVDQGIEILTGLAAGERDGSGRFPAGTINFRVERRLADFAGRSRAPAAGDRGSARNRPQRRR
jgi:lon-related putative ATP-dependent protease